MAIEKSIWVLELEDFVMLPAAVRDGALSEEQATVIRQVSGFTASFSGRDNAALWRVDQLGSAWQSYLTVACGSA